MASDVLLACCGAPEALPAVLARRLKRTGASRALLLNVLRSIRPQLSLGRMRYAHRICCEQEESVWVGDLQLGDQKVAFNRLAHNFDIFPLFGKIDKRKQAYTTILVILWMGCESWPPKSCSWCRMKQPIPMLSSWWVKRCGVVWCCLLGGRTDLGLQFRSFKWMAFVSQFLWSPQQIWFLQQLNVSPTYRTQRKFCLLPVGLLWYSHPDVIQMLEMEDRESEEESTESKTGKTVDKGFKTDGPQLQGMNEALEAWGYNMGDKIRGRHFSINKLSQLFDGRIRHMTLSSLGRPRMPLVFLTKEDLKNWFNDGSWKPLIWWEVLLGMVKGGPSPGAGLLWQILPLDSNAQRCFMFRYLRKLSWDTFAE